jgi:hypothetical protein
MGVVCSIKKRKRKKEKGERKIFIPPFEKNIYEQPKSSFKVFKVQERYEFHSKES